MKNKYSIFILTMISAVALLVSCGSQKQKNADNKNTNQTAQVNPVEVFENEYSEVAKVTLNPGEELAEHDGDVRLIYSLSDFSIEWKEKGSVLGTKTWKKGDIHIHEAGKHSAKNNGTSKAEWIVFARKNKALPKCEELSLNKDVNIIKGNYSQQIFDNDRFRVTEIKLAVNDSLPMHEGINRIIYPLSDYKILYQSSKEGTFEKSFKNGDAHWHECDKHSIKNIGNTEARFLIVSYK